MRTLSRACAGVVKLCGQLGHPVRHWRTAASLPRRHHRACARACGPSLACQRSTTAAGGRRLPRFLLHLWQPRHDEWRSPLGRCETTTVCNCLRTYAPAMDDGGAADNIRVYCRVRPLQKGARRGIAAVEDASRVVINNKQSFNFGWVAGPDSTQEAIFENVGKPLAQSFLDGWVAAGGALQAQKVRRRPGGIPLHSPTLPTAPLHAGSTAASLRTARRVRGSGTCCAAARVGCNGGQSYRTAALPHRLQAPARRSPSTVRSGAPNEPPCLWCLPPGARAFMRRPRPSLVVSLGAPMQAPARGAVAATTRASTEACCRACSSSSLMRLTAASRHPSPPAPS